VFLKRFYNDQLAQASYLVGCEASGEALVVDPNRDIEQYLAAAVAQRLRVRHVTETHIHADFVSGSRELARRAGATLYVSAEGGDRWQYSFAGDSGVCLLRDGGHFQVGNLRVDVRHTPGHTPEHLTLLVTDTASADRAMGAFTGDFIFVGDVGRPDLLERAANVKDTMEVSSRELFRSLRQFGGAQPDYLQLWPGHGAGSACGKSLGAVPQSTLGYEKLFNWAFGVSEEDAFVEAILAGQPEPPKYFARMKQVNRDGPPALNEFRAPERLGADALGALIDNRAVVVDARPTRQFAEGHTPGTINIPAGDSFVTWAGWLIPYDRDVYLIVGEDEGDRAGELARGLSLIGLDRVRGYFATEALESWRSARGVLARTGQMSVEELASHLRRGVVTVVDVRGRAEWEAGHLPGVQNVPLGYLADRLAELPRDRPLVLHCQTGSRSSIGASVLQAHGFSNVVNLEGGYARWREAGNAVEREEPSLAR
jgi:hydroxyacylglutathione hydrolase